MKKTRIKGLMVAMMVLGFLTVFLVHGSYAADQFLRFPVATPTGTWYPTSVKIGELLETNIPGIKVSVGLGGSEVNPKYIQKDEAELGWTYTSLGFNAFKGLPPYKAPCDSIRHVVNMTRVLLYTVVRKDSGIKTFQDLKKMKRIRTHFGPLASFPRRIVEALFDSYGIGPKSIKAAGGTVNYGGTSDAVTMLKDKIIDVFSNMTAPGASYLRTANRTPGINWLPLDDSNKEMLIKKFPGVIKAVQPGGVYEGHPEEVLTVAMTADIVCHKKLSADLVYKITKVILENLPALVKVHPINKEITLKNAVAGVSIPIHPGAEKYYKEKGIMK